MTMVIKRVEIKKEVNLIFQFCIFFPFFNDNKLKNINSEKKPIALKTLYNLYFHQLDYVIMVALMLTHISFKCFVLIL